jgi:hypothetical protein
VSALAYARRYLAHDQSRFPLATLLIVACERPISARVRLLALAERESISRERAFGIPSL